MIYLIFLIIDFVTALSNVNKKYQGKDNLRITIYSFFPTYYLTIFFLIWFIIILNIISFSYIIDQVNADINIKLIYGVFMSCLFIFLIGSSILFVFIQSILKNKIKEIQDKYKGIWV